MNILKFIKRKHYQPMKPEGHEGMGTSGRIAFTNAERSWVESFDLIEILKDKLIQHNLSCNLHKGWLMLNNGLYLRPEIDTFQPLEPNGVRTVTSISIAHENYFPKGLFEYQHATGDDTISAVANGFNDWLMFDYPAINEAVTNRQDKCTVMDMEFTAPTNRVRRALLGPVSHLVLKDIKIEEEHPFCPCCLLTNSFDAFKQYFEAEGFFAIRLLALRDENGEVSSDCRVNGVDLDLGKEHLIKYGETWPDRGFEMRKQYVVIYTKDSIDE